MTITVEDRRADREASAALTDAIEQNLHQAMAPARPEPCPCFTLAVVVPVHRGVFPGGGGGNWWGLTVIQATLVDDAGRELYRFLADDRDAQWNAFGGASGTKAAQQSLRDALRKLVRQMAQHDLSEPR